MSSEFSYNDYHDYILRINAFENEIMKALQNDNSKKIDYVGVSIQFFEEVQDDYSPTRTHTNAKNSYCSKVQETNKDKCNTFDIEAKEYLKSFDDENATNQKDLICFCHANVTNYLFKFNPCEIQKYSGYKYENKGIDLYIFIGHFLLNEFPDEKTIANDVLFYDESDGHSYAHLNEFKPVKQSDKLYKKKYIQGDDNDFRIATSTFTKLTTVKNHIIDKFVDFLEKNDYLTIEAPSKNILLSENLVSISQLPSIDRITKELQSIERLILNFESISADSKTKYFSKKKKISANIKDFKAKLYQIKGDNGASLNEESKRIIDNAYNDHKLYEVYNWLKSGNNGSIGSRRWLSKCPI